jgi:putative PIN family toxin of toxin-antitoxin system
VRIVLDTNIFISAFFWGGNPRVVLERCIEGIDELICSREILRELNTVMLRPKFGLEEAQVDYFLKAIEEIARIVAVPDTIKKLCRDSNDDHVIACAVMGNASCLKSGDEDLLVMKHYEGVMIYSPEAYLKAVSRP